MKNLTSLLTSILSALALPALPSLAQSVYEPYTFTTLAGRNPATSLAGTWSEAMLSQPRGLAMDMAGNAYAADSGSHTIRKVTQEGEVTMLAGLAGSPGSADGTGIVARFRNPGGVTVDRVGNVYVTDTNNHTIRKLTRAGVVTTLAGLAESPGSADGPGSGARFNGPAGVAVDSAGNAYVADSGSHTIRKVTPAGVVTTLAGLAGSSGSADGVGEAQFFAPTGVAVDSAGNVYVTDTENSTIRKVTPAGKVTTLAGRAGGHGSADGPGIDARFAWPSGVAVDSAGNVYVADSGNGTIRKVTSTGVVTTLAGVAGCSGSADGTGSDARFALDKPLDLGGFLGFRGVALDCAGILYVADMENNTIRTGNPPLIILKAGFDGPRFALNLTGQMGRSVTLEASTDLVNWRFLGAAGFSNTNNQLTMTDPAASPRPRVRFYRVSYQPVLFGE